MPQFVTTRRILPALMLTLTTALPASSQDEMSQGESSADVNASTFKDMMSGTPLPLSLKIKDLTPEYRRIVVGGQQEQAMFMQTLMAKTGMQFGVYYTKGDTVTMGGETYLISYRPQIKINPNLLMGGGHHRQNLPTEPRKLAPDTSLALSLLNLRTTGSLNDVRPFNPKLDIESYQEANNASVRTLKLLGTGFMTYLKGRGKGTLPALGETVTPALQRAVYPDVGDEQLFVHPTTNEPYKPNPMLSGRKVAHISDTKSMALFYEATPAPDGSRAVLFLDGHVERVPRTKWARIKKASKLK